MEDWVGWEGIVGFFLGMDEGKSLGNVFPIVGILPVKGSKISGKSKGSSAGGCWDRPLNPPNLLAG
jgi:hypothetical protein